MISRLKLVIFAALLFSSEASSAADPNLTPPCSGVRWDLTYWTSCEVSDVRYWVAPHPAGYNNFVTQPGQALLGLRATETLRRHDPGQVGGGVAEQILGIVIQPSVGTFPDPNYPPLNIRWVQRASETSWFSSDRVEKAVNYIAQVVDGTKGTIVAWVRNPGDRLAFLAEMGERITTGLSGAVTNLAGLVVSMGQGALDPDVALGAREIYRAVNDPDPRLRSLLQGEPRRSQLRRILDELEEQGAPIQPRRVQGNRSTFEVVGQFEKLL
jgi:hypothetical protein